MPTPATSSLEFRHRVTEEDQGFTPVPNAVLLDVRIPAMIRLCYTIIKSYAFGQKCGSYPSQKTLADQLNVKERSVRYYLEELVVLGLITTEQRGLGKTNIYWIEPLTGLDDHVKKYLQWKADKQKARQPVASQDRQYIAGQERQPVTDPGGNTLPTNNTTTNNTTEEVNTLAESAIAIPPNVPPEPLSEIKSLPETQAIAALNTSLEKIAELPNNPREEPKEKVPPKRKGSERKPWSDLTDAMHQAIPAAIRPPGNPHYGKANQPAEALYKEGFTGQQISAYVEWAYVHDKWICCGGEGGAPIVITMSYVNQKIKAWQVSQKGLNGNASISGYSGAEPASLRTGSSAAGGTYSAAGSGGSSPRVPIPSIIPAAPGIPRSPGLPGVQRAGSDNA